MVNSAKPSEPLDGPVAVVREAGFVRATVDTAVAVFLGRDVELALLTATPTVSLAYLEGPTGSIPLEGEMALVESVRARMSPYTAANIAFNLLFVLLQNEELDEETVRGNLDMILSSIKAAAKSAA